MKKCLLCALLSLVFVLSLCPSFVQADDISLSFSSANPAVAYCINTEQFLYENRQDETFAPGVFTKLAAMMVAYDLCKATAHPLTTEITVKGAWVKDTYIAGDRSTPYLGLRDGDTCTLQYLFAASLVSNANDALAALVHYCSETLMVDTTDAFLARMNEKAASLGMKNTAFADTIGFGGKGKITAHDAALLAAAFYPYNDLVVLSDCYSYGTLKNKNYLKCNYLIDGYLMEEAVGLIAGHATNEGNYSIVTYVEKDGNAFAFVAANGSRERIETDGMRWFDPGNTYEDMHGMVPYVMESFGFVSLCGEGDLLAELRMGGGAEKDFLILVPAHAVEKMISNPKNLPIETVIEYDTEKVYEGTFAGKEVMMIDAPVSQGDVVGKAKFVLDGKTVATVELVARDSVEVNTLLNAAELARVFLFEGPMGTIIGIVVRIVLIWLAISLLWLLVKLVVWILRKQKEKDAHK